jgi:hypothetical protein
MAGRSNSGTAASGIRVGDRYLSPARVAAIRSRNLASKPSPVDRLVPSARPISADEAARLQEAGRGSGELDPTRTGTDPDLRQAQGSSPTLSLLRDRRTTVARRQPREKIAAWPPPESVR